MHFKTTIEINAPPDRVWDALVDVETWPEWTASIREVKGLDGAVLAFGSRVRIKQPRMPSLVWEVSEFEPTTSFTWRSSSPGVTTVGSHVVTATTTNRVTVTLGIHQSGPLAPIVRLLAGARTRRYVQMEADGLKKCAETSL